MNSSDCNSQLGDSCGMEMELRSRSGGGVGGRKRAADESIGLNDDQRFTKRFNLLSIGMHIIISPSYHSHIDRQ